MIYFDKQPNIVDGEGYTRDYLGSSFDENSHRFLPSLQNEESFNCFRNHRYISHSQHNDPDFKSLLLREQCGHCCYCMRRIGIDANDCNIEHVVPKNSPIDDFRYYASYSNLLILLLLKRNTIMISKKSCVKLNFRIWWRTKILLLLVWAAIIQGEVRRFHLFLLSSLSIAYISILLRE